MEERGARRPTKEAFDCVPHGVGARLATDRVTTPPTDTPKVAPNQRRKTVLTLRWIGTYIAQ
jgi:hypothetical protein